MPAEQSLSEYHEALALARVLVTPAGWDDANTSPYRPYSFPRSQLLSAIEEAVAQSGPAGGNEPAYDDPPAGHRAIGTYSDQDAAVKRLSSLRPREPVSGPLAALRSLMTVLMPIVAIVLSVELTTLSTPQLAPTALIVSGLVILASWGVLIFRQSLTAPLSALFPASHWFATSTFILGNDQPDDEPPSRWRWLGMLLPRRSRRLRAAREERARMVVSQLSTAYYGAPAADQTSGGDSDRDAGPQRAIDERERAMELYLSLRVHALLEDLRANYRPWTFDLRRRKRKWPPMLFLPGVDQELGCVRFVQAVSDLRSRRSENDPLLILASSRHPLEPHAVPEPEYSTASPYMRWIGRLRVEQSPSQGRRLPWVLLQKVRADSAGLSADRRYLPRAGWSAWQLWSRWTLAFAVALLIIGGFWRSQVISREYCGGWLFGHDPDLVLVHRECIGIDTTGTTAFLPVGRGVTLSGGTVATGVTSAAGSRVTLSQVNLAYLENLIDKQNQEAAASGNYVTFVYAGALTAPNPTDQQGALQELTGMFAWQYYVNVTQKDPVKIRIDIANDGDGAAHEQRMAQAVIAASAQDPSIKGVIGLGIDTLQTATAVQDFTAADIPVLDTTNSDDNLPQKDDYFGLSPTNAEEAQALVTKYARNGKGRVAAVFELVGSHGKPSDPYALQQAQSAETDLRHAGYRLAEADGEPGPIRYSTRTDLAGTPDIVHAACDDHPSVVYLAGRHGDLKQLVGLINAYRDCFAANVTVLSGDDMTALEFPRTTAPALATRMNLYYVAQTDPAHVPAAPGGGAGSADNGSNLSTDLQKAFSLNGTPSYSDPVLGNGLIALAFDAADLLYKESTTGSGPGEQEQRLPRTAVAPGLRCPEEPVSNGATGTLGFVDVRHGLDIFKAVNAAGGPRPQRVTFQFHRQTVTHRCPPNVKP